MSKTKGIHHVAMRPSVENYQKVVSFYTDVLQMEMKRTWGTADKPCCMIDIGGGSCMELSYPRSGKAVHGRSGAYCLCNRRGGCAHPGGSHRRL